MQKKPNGSAPPAPKSLAKLSAESVPVTVRWREDQFTFRYRPSAWNMKTARLIFAGGVGDPEWREKYIEGITRVLAEWDLQTAEGEPLEITPEAIEEVPSQMWGSFIDAIQEDVSVGKSSSGQSSTP